MLKIEISLTEKEYKQLKNLTTDKKFNSIDEKIKYLVFNYKYLHAEHTLTKLQNKDFKENQEMYDFFINSFLDLIHRLRTKQQTIK